MGITPGATGADFDVLLAFSLDADANERVEKRISTIQEELKRIQEEAGKAGKAVNATMQSVEKKADTAQKSVAKVGVQLATLGERAKQSSTLVNQALDGNIRKYRELEQAASRAKQQAAQVSGVAGRASSVFGQGLITGGAAVGGILAEANRFAKEEEAAGRATQATREWTRATEDLARARRKVDNVLLREALPLLKEGARVANQAANFIEKHPQIVQAALKAGTIVAGLSAVGLAVSKGIKLVADVQYISASILQEKAATKQLEAALLQNKAAVTNRADDLRGSFNQAPSKGGDLFGTIGKAIVIAEIARISVNTVLDKLGQPRLEAIRDAELEFLKRLPEVLAGKIKLNELALEVVKAANATAKPIAVTNAGGASASAHLQMTENERAIATSYARWQEDLNQITNQASEKRKQIIADAEKAINEATSRHTAERRRINQQADRARASLISNFTKESIREEQQYADQRADIIRDAGEEVQRIEAQHQENIRKRTLDFYDQRDELTAARDALGLAKAQRQYDRDISEAERATNLEIAQRRRDTAIRLQDLANQYAAERAQRQEDFQQALQENAAQRQEQLKQADEAYRAETKQARDAKAQQLRDLQEGLNAERARRREVFIAEIRDLDAALLGERDKKRQYQELMLQDAYAWAAKYRAALPGGPTSALATASGSAGGLRDSGGYAERGLYRLAWNGQREFVMSGSSTRTAERIIGAQLTQDNLMRALAAFGPSRQANYQNNMKLYQTPSKDMLRLMEQIAERAIDRMLR